MKKTRGKLLLAAIAMQLFGWGTANAAEPAFMHTGGRTTQPVGHYELCQQIPQECNQRTPNRAPVELTRKLWATIVKINNSVNSKVAPRTDMEMWGKEEVWSFPKGFGDCEDYALEKRRELMSIGVPAGDLLMTVVRQRNGDGHAVLTVRTSLGEFILDNLQPKVLSWTNTSYTYLKRQSDRNSGAWVTINDGRSDAVASVR
ncbi:transglutaminase-like cysteine peptidase [Mesorhizobium sp. M1163]|uniref:transglutaminase-like cysteine peptidase n=1 Tax=Mesorhizobium sp. M1163 TaxID=2957065 RepID=UPI00333AF4F7